jgi:uncharacterized protein YdiU (UPF0061 family)
LAYLDTADGSQRFGLKTSQADDQAVIVKPFLDLLHRHSLDFHTAFRHLSSLPLSDGPTDLEPFLETFCSTTSPSGERPAPADFVPWFEQYVSRASGPEEKEAWAQIVLDESDEAARLYGVDGGKSSSDGWAEKRKRAMERVNPRFVLRQWVLEELIAQLEGMQSLQEGRQALARILDVSGLGVGRSRC